MERHRLNPIEINDLLMKFYIKLAETLAREKKFGLASEQVLKARKLSASATRKILLEKGLHNAFWADESLIFYAPQNK